ncbi:GxxExxY protein [Flavobacterium azooxidireducens]|uniref:GxxExxY protein n=1 Tax=Flavobacterium azooxidireducens TaxID=1871076 RepID=A0ABY4KJV8_9FLAO|nr:GxxExxY protein [Flavobacterium azooxidireducens]UPQ80834.1 GxxExxY protein [Flavobacterium azooxidireducens]
MPRRKEDAKIMITDEEERIAKIIVNSAYQVHKKLGPGLLEKIYEACLAYELEKAGLKVKRQIDLPIIYDELYFDEGLRLDLYVEESIIIEIKAVDIVNPIWKAQLISHLKLTQNQLGFLINFNVPLIKDGIKRYIYTKNY